MQKGLNTDMTILGIHYHVQTEDWGIEKSCLVTKIFKNGAVIKSIKTNYQDLVGKSINAQLIRDGLQAQHDKILDQLVSGKLK